MKQMEEQKKNRGKHSTGFTPLDSKYLTGFTLVELIVVIGIICLLGAFTIIGIDMSRKKARDAQRVADMKQYKQVFEMFFQQYNRYPDNTNDGIALTGEIIGDDTGPIEQVLLPFMTKVPGDALFQTGFTGSDDYYYAYDPDITADTCEGVIAVNRFETQAGLDSYGEQGVTAGANQNINTAHYNYCFKFSY